MKLWERVIEHRLRRITSVSEKQFGFMLGIDYGSNLFIKDTKRRKKTFIWFL